MLPIDFTSALENIVQTNERILFLGIGENRMGDDGFGPYVSHQLIQQLRKSSIERNIKIINGKTNYVERKREILEFNPDLLLILDTCQPNNNIDVIPGTLLVGKEEELVNWLPLSSHVLPIPVFISELKTSLINLKSALIGVIPVSTDHTNEVLQFKPEIYSLDDYEQNPDLPFYEFSLSPRIQKIADELVAFLLDILKKPF
jgi:hydrogenase maturation protease